MNTHIPQEIIEKYPTYEFQGKPFTLKNGNTYIRAHHKSLGKTFFYSFSEDFFWMDKEDILSLSK